MPFRNLQNPYEPVRVLSDDHVEAIHLASLRLLSDTGLRVLDAATRQYFADAGCVVDEIVVRFDPEMVVEAIARAPAAFTLRARNPDHDLVIGGRNVVFGSVGGPAFANDVERGRRPGTL